MNAAAAKMVEALGDLMPEGGAGAVRFTFDCMEAAEDEIARAKRRWPKSVAKVDAAFLALMPTPVFRGKAIEVYRSHVVELLGRARVGTKLEPATEAEVLLALLAMSLIAPPSQQYAALADALFATVMPAAYAKLDKGHGASEPWPGASAELLGTMRRKLAQPRGPQP